MEPKINVAMIVKNEQQSLNKCLESVKLLGPIWAVDTGSTDDTVKILQNYFARISFKEWNNNFSDCRNFGLDQIPQGEWVFQIDADEYIDYENLKKIYRKAQVAKKKAILCTIIHDETGGRHVFPRLFRSELRFKDPVHNRLNNNDFEESDIEIHHSPSVNHTKDPERSLRILESIRKPSLREQYLLGREYLNFKKFPQAIKTLTEFIKKANPDQQTADAMLFLAQAHFMIKENQTAKYWCLEALILNPEFKEAFIQLAMMSDPAHMQTWLKYARSAENKGISNIPGKQGERIEKLQEISELALSGEKLEDVFKGREI